MGYKWKPNKAQKAAFKERMKDEVEQAAYNERKRLRHSYEGFKDKDFIPTQGQYDYAIELLSRSDYNLSHAVSNACNIVVSGYSCQEKINHSYIHIINAIQRGEKQISDTEF